MPNMTNPAQAYEAAATFRNVREQEADVFRRTVGALKAAQKADLLSKTRALADNRRLWSAVYGLMMDPRNALPDQLRASIVSVGLAVQREMEREQPNFDFLITINENMAAGLSAAP